MRFTKPSASRWASCAARLGLRTAMLLGLDAAGKKLNIQELDSSEDAILPRPFQRA
ncbi:MAG: hypothetical protein QM756_28665 [Polyangiaceae bacterium]